MNAAERALDLLSRSLMVLASLAILGMMVQVVIDVALRNIWHSTLAGTEEVVSAYYMIGCAFLPLAWVQRERGHVIIELFTSWLPERSTAFLDGVVMAVVGAGLLVFTVATFDKALAMTADNEIMIGTIDVTVWPSRWMLPIGIGAMALCMILQSVQEFGRAFGLLPPRPRPAALAEDIEPI
ncbi:TRAP transporter small permease [Azospirillum sp. RWY-5-1]|uniref:TRAP transporter small permease protein n=1 Tax=Azospirillum oleiclasticum TaxID=2735135 RepID=A0ABX2TLP4_9PROT|nr:TRAP transporter small permease [Azospirillum oleiclasticum]NYZ16527.1 TRAP transporter small permease [Azospirillum oleiclasticum]NYZ24003.1 TRAP transporter small permease [Azospirillum oleiclasticum]